MELFNAAAVLMVLAALLSYINYRYLHLPSTIGLMVLTLIGSLVLILVSKIALDIEEPVAELVAGLDFKALVLDSMLGFLLFAGALHVNLNGLAEQKRVIATLATAGIVASTVVVGYLCYWGQGLLGIDISLVYWLLFGALISPTDPIAVLGILKTAGVPKTLETKIVGESLFNDGIGVVVFIALLGFVGGEGQDMGAAQIGQLFLAEAVGGVVYGLAIGLVTFALLKQVDNYIVEVLMTLALVMGGYALAHTIHTSGPIAMVVSGLLIGNQGRRLAMSEQTVQRLDNFWELIDEILNAVLFVLIGLEVLALSFAMDYLVAGLLAIPLVLAARFICVGATIQVLRRWRTFTPHVVTVMTWGGLRGGISVALALSLPRGAEREILLVITYVIVVFSIVVQGLSTGPLIARLKLGSDEHRRGH